jgi:maltokinase
VIGVDHLSGVLGDHLDAYLERQRWSGAPEGGIDSAVPEWIEAIGDDPLLVWMVVDATLATGDHQRYQLFLGARPTAPWPDFLEGKEREILAVVPEGGDGEEVVVYDALIDPDLAVEVLHLVAPDQEVEVRRPIVLEHSNSSVVFDERIILKVLRRIEPGANPDVEITRVLAEQGYEHVLPPLAELRRDDTDLAVLRHFLVGATEGWQLARASVRDLLASRMPPEECGGDFAPDAARLGDVIAGLHVAMDRAWGHEAGDVVRWVEQIRAGLDDVLQLAKPGTFDVDAVRARLDATASLTDAGAEIRIHGDLHLSQVIQVDSGWLVLDFEGEPARRRDDRFTQSSPLRDVAGMLRSLHYAAATGLAEWDQGDEELVGLLAEWEARNRDAFLSAYEAHEGIDALLPADPAGRASVLAAFELDKAVYELGYELAYRPELASIPLAGIQRLTDGRVAT